MTVMVSRRWMFGLAAAMLLSACTQGGPFPTPAFDKPVEDPQSVIEATDWDIAETITIDIRQNEFNPTIVRLFQGEPYVIVMENRDDITHVFAAPEFFRISAIRKVVTEEEEIQIERLAAISLKPGAIKEIHLVPLRDGWYSYQGGGPGILLKDFYFGPFSRGAVFGMVGTIIVEP